MGGEREGGGVDGTLYLSQSGREAQDGTRSCTGRHLGAAGGCECVAAGACAQTKAIGGVGRECGVGVEAG